MARQEFDAHLQAGDSTENAEDSESVRLWKESPFAVGLTKPTWKDENLHFIREFSPMAFSALCCRRAGRVGNMVVLRQRIEQYRDTLTGQVHQRPRLMCVLGPYWMIPLFLTVPLFSSLACWSAFTKLRHQTWGVIVSWSVCNGILFMSLLLVGCRDPGIMYRHHELPNTEEGATWRWNDQAATYRPAHARYDPECAVVIEEFDHTCAWTGTAIGKNNMLCFRIFTSFVIVTIVFDVVVLAFL